ncbi:hypothetical protein QTN47_23995 [Danxiaibacter flavus]|uniref:DoxX family protein n=1 Tax=Danxiaibacter flavus TaxID=3049108 RepID=A0ABV3ZL27_9BACT|nr:hypothetical protein QNM32_24000 [Chitinophagaceae bacterium DXS]
MNNAIISRIAIIGFGIVLAIFGIKHFLDPENLAIMVPSFIPGGKIWVYIVGTAFILAAIAFIINRKVKLAGYLLALMLIIFVITIHLRGYMDAGDKELQAISFVNMLKDLALACAALVIGSTYDNTQTIVRD